MPSPRESPVIVIMYLAIKGNWGTHYDAIPPDVSYPRLANQIHPVRADTSGLPLDPLYGHTVWYVGMVAIALLRRREA